MGFLVIFLAFSCESPSPTAVTGMVLVWPLPAAFPRAYSEDPGYCSDVNRLAWFRMRNAIGVQPSARLATYECVREICRRDEHGFFRTRSRNPSATRNCVTTDSAGWAGPAKSTDWPWSHFTLHFLTHLPPETLTYFLILEFIFGFFSKFSTFF